MAVSTTIPQGLHSQLFGYSSTSGNSADAFNAYIASSNVTASLLINLGPNAVAIGGRQFVIDTSIDAFHRDAFRHKSLSPQRQSVNMNNVMGEGTINTEGLWRRAQVDWSEGAGQKYLDRLPNAPQNRFYKSKGVEVLENPYQLTLLNGTRQLKSSTSATLMTARSLQYMYISDGTTVWECSDTSVASPVWNACSFATTGSYTAPTTGQIYSMDCTDGYVFVATATGIFYYQSGTTGANSRKFYGYAKPDPSLATNGYSLVRYCNNRVVAGANGLPTLFVFSTTHITGNYPNTGGAPSASVDVMMTHPNPGFKWIDACGGSSAIYYIGYVYNSGGTYSGGQVYKSGVVVDGTTLAVNLAFPTIALPLSPDEYPTCIQNYLNYVFVGTNRGIRMCQTLNQYDPSANGSGDLKSGPLIPNTQQPVTYPVRAITGSGRYVWFGWSNYDTNSTGLGRLDISNFINNNELAPAYASDLMVDGAGEILDLSWDSFIGQPVFAVSGKGWYTKDTSKYVSQGSLYSGGFTYGIPDHKIPVYFDYGVDMPDDTPSTATYAAYVDATLESEPFDPSQKQSIPIAAATEGLSQVPISGGTAYKSETFQAIVTLHSDSTLSTTPTLYRWTLEAWPAVVTEASITVPIQLHLVNVVDGLETYSDPYAQFSFLEDLRRSQTIVMYQEGTLTANVIVDSLDWLPFKRQGNYENGFEGDCIVVMKTIGGYTPYPGYPTQ